jgi:hypothetical protein
MSAFPPDGPRIEYASIVGVTRDLFCVERPFTVARNRSSSHVGNPTYLAHFYPSRLTMSVCGFREDDAIRVRLTVIETSDDALYYGWYDAHHQRLSMVFHARSLVAMCFPYGPRAEEERGRGLVVALRVELLDRVEPQPGVE